MKKFLSMLMAFAMILSFAACGDSEPQKENGGGDIPISTDKFKEDENKENEENEPEDPVAPEDEPESLEADIIFDADKLDSLGAVGIGRAFIFAGHENARLHNTEDEALNSEAYSKEDTAYREYLVKLRYLPRRMRSAAGRKLAVEKAAFMADFFERLNSEIYNGEIF